MPAVEARYRIKSEKGARAVAGLFYGRPKDRFMYACHRPDVFAVSLCHECIFVPVAQFLCTNTDDPVHKEIRKRVAENNAVRYIRELDAGTGRCVERH